jgi:hypothetical protein
MEIVNGGQWPNFKKDIISTTPILQFIILMCESRDAVLRVGISGFRMLQFQRVTMFDSLFQAWKN